MSRSSAHLKTVKPGLAQYQPTPESVQHHIGGHYSSFSDAEGNTDDDGTSVKLLSGEDMVISVITVSLDFNDTKRLRGDRVAVWKRKDFRERRQRRWYMAAAANQSSYDLHGHHPLRFLSP